MPDLAFLTDYGYGGLFAAAFLAATLLPLGSELILSALYLQGLDPIGLFWAASIGNIAGSVLNYALGYGLLHIFQRTGRTTKAPSELQQKITKALQRYGVVLLLFAWVPIIGDPLTVAAGTLRLPFRYFLLFVSIGKAGRYAVILYTLSL